MVTRECVIVFEDIRLYVNIHNTCIFVFVYISMFIYLSLGENAEGGE